MTVAYGVRGAVRSMLTIPVIAWASCAKPDSAATSSGGQPAPSTTVLPGPEGGGEAFEPSIAIDPANPERIVVAAMYGNPGARGGRGIWSWESRDGGRGWVGARMQPPLVGSKPAGWAADVIAGIDGEGTAVLTSMAGARDPKSDGLGGIVVARRGKADSSFGIPVQVMRDSPVPGTDRAISYDKPWMTIDRDETSRYRGTVYVMSGVLDLVLPAKAWAENPTDMSRLKMLGLDFAVSRDGGKTFGPSRRLVDSVFGEDMTVSRGGVLEVVYPKSNGGTSAIIHLRSTDGGETFEKPVEIVTARPGTGVSGGTVATRPDGTLMACWSEQPATGPPRIRCAERREAGWMAAEAISVPVPPATTFMFPTLAGTAKGWYLTLHLIGAAATDVVLYRSDGRTDFRKVTTLTTVPGLGLPQWCFTRECRFFRPDQFISGDYASLAASGGRLATAYVLPRPGGPLFGRAAVYVTVMAEPE